MLETRWPLVGRGEELSALTAALVAGRGAVITGPAGAGKTTLAMMCLQLVRDREMSVVRTTATHVSQRLPFGTLAPILPDPGVDRLSRDGHGQLLRFYTRAVTARAGGRPLVVFVDDAHLLDDGSATLVHHLALTGTATVLVTVRTGEPAPDSVVSMWKDGMAERVEVGALGDAAIEELLVTVLGGPVDTASVRQLADHSQGKSALPAGAGDRCGPDRCASRDGRYLAPSGRRAAAHGSAGRAGGAAPRRPFRRRAGRPGAAGPGRAARPGPAGQAGRPHGRRGA